MNERNYIEELKNGKQLRIQYKKNNYDGCDDGGWWSEELFVYDKVLDLFRCYYPVSFYKKDFCTYHTEDETIRFIKEFITNFKSSNKEITTVTEIILEDCTIPAKNLSIRELAMNRINQMTYDELRNIFLL